VASSRHQYGRQVALARRPILSASCISISCITKVEGCTLTTWQARCYVLSSGYWFGFTSSVLIANRTFLHSSANHLKWESMLSPLCCICGVPKLAIFLLSTFLIPTQELCLLLCGEPSSQLRNDTKYHSTSQEPLC
jgi:hypothetical protein